MKRFLCLILTITAIMTMTAIPTAALKNGDVVNYVLYTDIVTYINDHPIQSYNIDGYTAVIVEDLVNYGFNVNWNASKRSLSVTLDPNGKITSTYKVKPNTHKIGSRAMSVLYTDIVTYLDGNKVKSYNVDGRTIVYVDDLADYYSSSYVWSGGHRTLSMTLKTKRPAPTPRPQPVEPPVKPDYKWEYNYSQRDSETDSMYYGFSFEFKNDKKGKFRCTSKDGSYNAVSNIKITADSIGFVIPSVIKDSKIEGTVLSDLESNINIDLTSKHNTVRDSTSQRNKLSKYFYVEINGTPVKGQLQFDSSYGNREYTLILDDKYQQSDIQILLIQAGEIKKKPDNNISAAIDEILHINYVFLNGQKFETKPCENIYRLPEIDSTKNGAVTLNKIMLRDFENYTFLNGLKNIEVYNELKKSGGNVYASYHPDFSYYRTVDFKTETDRNDVNNVIIYVTYNTYVFNGGVFTDTVAYGYNFKTDTYKHFGAYSTNYVTNVAGLQNLGLKSNDPRVLYLSALMSGDEKTLEYLAQTSSGSLKDLAEAQITGFAATTGDDITPNAVLKLIIDVKNSKSGTLPAGRNIKYLIQDARGGWYLSSTSEPEEQSKAEKSLGIWLSIAADPIFDNELKTDEQRKAHNADIYNYLITAFGPQTAEQLSYRAAVLFNDPEFKVPKNVQPDRFSQAYSSYASKPVQSYYTVENVKEAGSLTAITVQFYTDSTYTKLGDREIYTLTETPMGCIFVQTQCANP